MEKRLISFTEGIVYKVHTEGLKPFLSVTSGACEMLMLSPKWDIVLSPQAMPRVSELLRRGGRKCRRVREGML